MDFIIENFEYIALIILLIVVAITIAIMIYVSHISNYFSNKKFRILGRYEYEVQTAVKEIVLQVFNNNINDTRIVGFGFIYKEQSIDYFKTYAKLNELDPHKQLIVISRESFQLHIPSKELETIILDYNKGKRHVSSIKVYAIDYQGIITKSKASSVRKIIAKNIKNDYLKKKSEEKKLKLEIKNEKKQERKSKRILNQLNRKEKFSKWWLMFSAKFKRVKK